MNNEGIVIVEYAQVPIKCISFVLRRCNFNALMAEQEANFEGFSCEERATTRMEKRQI